MLVERVSGKGSRGVGRGGEDVGVLDYADDVGCVTTSCAFGVVGVDCAVFDGSDGRFHEAGFVECVGMDETLDVQFIADG